MQNLELISLKDPSLLRTQAFVAGEWQDATNRSTFEVRNPATGRLLGAVPNMGAGETRHAIDAANRAWVGWRAQTAKQRATVLHRWRDLMLENAEDLALILTAEQGKPLAESKGEIQYAASYLEWFAEEAKRIYGDTMPSPAPDKRTVVMK
jgi:succinate-semialdehyde dehydrogenase/glutarate-semialdehyde dehydrogenase